METWYNKICPTQTMVTRHTDFLETTVSVTRVNEELIHRFAVTLDMINSGAAAVPEKFGEYARQTTALFVQLYN